VILYGGNGDLHPPVSCPALQVVRAILFIQDLAGRRGLYGKEQHGQKSGKGQAVQEQRVLVIFFDPNTKYPVCIL
jgi:hypothetical protein